MLGASGLVGEGGAPILDTIRPARDQGESRPRHRLGQAVAQQRHDVDCLARTIDAALGIEVGVDRARQRPAFDAAIGEVEGGPRHVLDRKVTLGAIGHDRDRRGSTGSAQKARIEPDVAVGVGCRSGELVIVASDKGDREPGVRQSERGE